LSFTSTTWRASWPDRSNVPDDTGSYTYSGNVATHKRGSVTSGTSTLSGNALIHIDYDHSNFTYTLTKTGTSSGGGETIPSAPSSVTATALSSSSISVTWTSVSGATSYDVYYEIGSSDTKNFAANVTGTSYTHTGLQANTTYYYYIKAKNNAGSSGYSEYSTNANATTSSGGTPSNGAGSSSSNAITIPSGGSIEGSFPAGQDEVWYKFTKNGTGDLYARDYEATAYSYTGDIVVDVYNSSLSLVSATVYDSSSGASANNYKLTDIDLGTGILYRIYSNWSGTYYVKVRPYGDNNSNKGTFALFAP
jgi:hypothetical protein